MSLLLNEMNRQWGDDRWNANRHSQHSHWILARVSIPVQPFPNLLPSAFSSVQKMFSVYIEVPLLASEGDLHGQRFVPYAAINLPVVLPQHYPISRESSDS